MDLVFLKNNKKKLNIMDKKNITMGEKVKVQQHMFLKKMM